MTPTWQRGRADIDAMLERRELEFVAPDRSTAERLLGEATRHLSSARAIVDTDSTGAFQLAYDAARKSLTAILAAQGLRPTTSGGHLSVSDAARAQFSAVLGHLVTRFSAMRRIRNNSEYPTPDRPSATRSEADRGIEDAEAIMTRAARIVDHLDPFIPRTPQ